MSVIGSEAVICGAIGCLFSSPERRVFSSEQRRFEGDGLEEGSAFSIVGSLMTLFVSISGSLVLLAIGRLAAVGLSAIFLCRFSLRARVRSNSF